MVREGFILDGVERCLKDYPDNVRRIRERRYYLECVRRKSTFEPRYGGGMRVSHQEAMLMLFEDDYILKDLASKVEPVTLFLETTATDMDRKLLELRYFYRSKHGKALTWEEISKRLDHTPTHLRGYHRTRLLERASLCFQRWNDDHARKDS